MSKLKIMVSNAIDAMRLSASPKPVPALPESHLQNSRRARPMRVIGSRLSLTGEGLNEAVDGFALSHHNLSADASVRLRLYASAGASGRIVYDSGAMTLSQLIPWGALSWGLDPWGGFIPNADLPKTFAIWFATTIALSFRLDVTATHNSHIDIGRLFIGKSFSPRHNYSYGGGISWVEAATQTRTEGGSLMVEAAIRYRRLKLDLNWLDEGDRDNLSRLLRRAGKTSDMLISLDPARLDAIGQEETVIGRRIDDFALHKTRKGYTRLSLTLEEI